MRKRFFALAMSVILSLSICEQPFAKGMRESVEGTYIEESIIDDELDAIISDVKSEETVEEEESAEDIEITDSEDIALEETIADESETVTEEDITFESEADYVEEEVFDEGAIPEVGTTDKLKGFLPDENTFNEALSQIITDDCENTMALDTSNGELNTLIIYKGYRTLDSDYDAVRVATDGELTILKYASKAKTDSAYKAFVGKYGANTVFYDHMEYIDNCEESANTCAEYMDSTDEGIESSELRSETVYSSKSDTPEYFAKLMGADTYKSKMDSSMKKKKIIVAVIDTGLNTTHEKIKDKWVRGYSFYNGGSYVDENGHGTNSAGCILGVTKGTNVKVMPIKVFPKSGGTRTSVIIAGIKYAYKHGANVINIGIGVSDAQGCTCMKKVIAEAYRKNVTVVVSAGNSNYDIDKNTYHPAAFRQCITVAAVKKSLKRAGTSNYGEAVDVTNYGVDIYMPYKTKKDAYRFNSGTSFACALTSGAVALLYAGNVATTPAKCEKILKSKSKDLGAKGWDKYYGEGIVRLNNITVSLNEGFLKKSIELKVGATKTGLFNNPRNLSVKYRTGNSRVATVDKTGKITAVGQGKTTISATTRNGKYTCKVTVIMRGISGAESVRVGSKIILRMINGYGETRWYSTDPKIASIDEYGVVTGLKKGKVTIAAINSGNLYTRVITVR